MAKVSKIADVRDTAVWLKITTWRGKSFAAVHWYGELVDSHYKQRVEIERVLTEQTAADMTRLTNDNSVFKYTYQSGDLTRSFDSVDELISRAKEIWKDEFTDKMILIRGDPVYDDLNIIDKR